MRPRIRTIKPEFYGHEKVREVPRATRFTMLGLIGAADDRGRLELLIPALRGFIYPAGDVTERQLAKEIEQIVAVRFAWKYESGAWTYLWLPNFWSHQRINRPSESDLPPHPEDPYRLLPIGKAMDKFKEDSEKPHGSFSEGSVNDHGSLTPSRAGARSLPIPSPPPSRKNQGETRSGRAASKRADQEVLPASLPTELHDTAREVLRILVAVQEERGGSVPTLRGVGLALNRFPDRDHLDVARRLEHWALVGGGAGRPVKDWPRTLATFLDSSPAAKPSRPANVVAHPTAGRFSEYDKAAGL